MDNNLVKKRGDFSPPHKNKFDFKSFKHNTCCCLNDIECFLNDCNRCYKYFKLYKLFK